MFRTIRLFSNSYSVSSLCKYFNVSKSGYYKFLHSRQDKDDELRQIIVEIQTKCKSRYGYRRIQIVLKNKYGLTVNHKRVLRVMNKYNK